MPKCKLTVLITVLNMRCSVRLKEGCLPQIYPTNTTIVNHILPYFNGSLKGFHDVFVVGYSLD